MQSKNDICHPLLTWRAIDMLSRINVFTKRNFLDASTHDIRFITNLSEDEINRIKDDLSLLVDLEPHVYREVGISHLDTFLGGGLRVGHVYEICGQSEAGKSKLCRTICLRLAQRGIGSFYVDLDGGLVPRDLLNMLTNIKGEDFFPSTILKLIRFQRIGDVDTLKKVLEFIIDRKCALKQFGFLVVDSIAHFHVLNLDENRNVQRENHRKLGECYKLMHLLAKKCKFTVFLTNLLLTNADDSKIEGASFNIGLKIDEKFPDFPFTRIRIEVARTDTSIARKLSVLRSSYIDAKATESVQLTNEGFI